MCLYNKLCCISLILTPCHHRPWKAPSGRGGPAWPPPRWSCCSQTGVSPHPGDTAAPRRSLEEIFEKGWREVSSRCPPYGEIQNSFVMQHLLKMTKWHIFTRRRWKVKGGLHIQLTSVHPLIMDMNVILIWGHIWSISFSSFFFAMAKKWKHLSAGLPDVWLLIVINNTTVLPYYWGPLCLVSFTFILGLDTGTF